MLSLIAALFAQMPKLFADRRDLLLENAALRQQLAVYRRTARPPRLRSSNRLFWVWLSRLWPLWHRALFIVQPETVIHWHRQAWKRYWAWKSRQITRGRPRISDELRDLIIRLARENPLWGAQRIRGELLGLGFSVGRETVRRYLHQGRRRPPSQTWRTFLRNHAADIWTCDFFTVQTFLFRTIYVFFFIAHDRRRLVHANVTAHPKAEWVSQQLIEATPWGTKPTYLIRDRDACFGKAFNAGTGSIGIEALLTPYSARRPTASPSAWSGPSAASVSTTSSS
jgi:putative transposase